MLELKQSPTNVRIMKLAKARQESYYLEGEHIPAADCAVKKNDTLENARRSNIAATALQH